MLKVYLMIGMIVVLGRVYLYRGAIEVIYKSALETFEKKTIARLLTIGSMSLNILNVFIWPIDVWFTLKNREEHREFYRGL